MRLFKAFHKTVCMALILSFAFTTCVYAKNDQKREFEAITATTGILCDRDYSSDDPADGLRDLFTILTGYSEERVARKDEPVKQTASYIFPPLVWGKTILTRVVNHPKLDFAKQYPGARRFMLNSLFVSATVRESSLMGMQFWDDLCAEEEFITSVKQAIEGKDQATFLYTCQKDDLFYSVAHITCKCRRMARTEEGEQILVECYDYYTFSPTEVTTDLNSTGEWLNEIGWQLYRLRLMSPFSSYAAGTITIK